MVKDKAERFDGGICSVLLDSCALKFIVMTFYSFLLLSLLCVHTHCKPVTRCLTGIFLCQTLLSEDLRPLVSLEALQREEVERPAAERGLLLL